MKKNLLSAIALCGLISFASCENDGDMIYLSPLEETTLSATSTEIVLTKENAGEIVLSLVWNGQDLVLSDTTMYVPDLLETKVVASLSPDMSNYKEAVVSSLSKAYSGMDLNVLAKDLNVTPDVPTSVYFSIMNSVGSNIDPVLSNVVEVKLTCYLIDMKRGIILDAKREETGAYLYSPEENGIYKGFMGATAWYNFYLLEGDNKLWGNVGADGSEFLISDEDMWNMWFPSPGGCYYTTVNTVSKQWDALYIESITLGGDISGEMTYDRPNNKWVYAFDASSSSVNITISGKGSQYNYATSTDDAAAIPVDVAFAGNPASLDFTDTPASFTVTVPATGESSLVLDLSDPSAFVCSVVSGSAIPEEISEYIWISGIDDLISGKWTFDNYARIYDEDNLAYIGVANVSSQWGYMIYTGFEDWGSAIGTDEEGIPTGGALVGGSTVNIPAPEAGLHLLDFRLKEMAYSTAPVTTVSFAGFNNDWTLIDMTETEIPGVFSSELNITVVSDWGAKVYLNGDWDIFFGGNGGNTYYLGQGITDDATLGVGTYTFTVDLIKGTYTIQ